MNATVFVVPIGVVTAMLVPVKVVLVPFDVVTTATFLDPAGAPIATREYKSSVLARSVERDKIAGWGAG